MQTTISNIFHFDGYKQIRTLTRPEDDSVLFCGKDVAEALGYKKPEKAISDHCKRAVMVNIAELGSSYPKTGGNPNMNFIPEYDVYRLIMKSRLKTAETFADWVCEEVLPTIRKTGMYSQTIAGSNLKPELQHAIAAHTEAQLKRMLDRLDRLDYYGTASKEAKASIAEKVAKEFNQPVELIEAIQCSGLAGAKVA